jgi:hypothetical protein
MIGIEEESVSMKDSSSPFLAPPHPRLLRSARQSKSPSPHRLPLRTWLSAVPHSRYYSRCYSRSIHSLRCPIEQSWSSITHSQQTPSPAWPLSPEPR